MKGIIMDISRRTGISPSAVCKILNNPFGFSAHTTAEVRKLYNELGGAEDDESLSVGVIVPNRPMYFWSEAVRGIKEGLGEIGRNGISFKLRFEYFHGADAGGAPACDAYIIYPRGEKDIRAGVPTVMLNDFIPEALGQNVVYVGADGISEGKMAAGIIRDRLPQMRQIAIVRSGGAKSASESNRIEGFFNAVREINTEVRLSEVEVDLSDGIAASLLAKKLARMALPDCIYVSTGKTNVAGLAISKLDKPGLIFCIGHECSEADVRYLKAGVELGYVKQDAFAQGRAAIEEIARFFTQGRMEGRIIPSAICLGGDKV